MLVILRGAEPVWKMEPVVGLSQKQMNLVADVIDFFWAPGSVEAFDGELSAESLL
jgi:hypothetical protein